jgi:predicted acyltransferase
MTANVPAFPLLPRPEKTGLANPGRLLSLDVFRGMIVAGMILVTNPGSYATIYWPLKHADWDGVTPTDMIFPSFLFIIGVSMTFSFAARRRRGETSKRLAGHVLQRSLLLIAIGLFLNGFPFFDLQSLRIPGTLQRIGLCYMGAGLYYLAVTRHKEEAESNAPAILGAIARCWRAIGRCSALFPCPVMGWGGWTRPATWALISTGQSSEPAIGCSGVGRCGIRKDCYRR